jgi:RimJ/RimL family protein N-acetyltransferase
MGKIVPENEMRTALTAHEVVDFFVTKTKMTGKKSYDFDYFDEMTPVPELFNALGKLLKSGRIALAPRSVEQLSVDVIRYGLEKLFRFLIPENTGVFDFPIDKSKWEALPEVKRERKRSTAPKGNHVKPKPVGTSQIRLVPAEEKHLPEIPALLDLVYQGDYPARQYTDLEWLKAQLENQYAYFRVFLDGEKVIGFGYQYFNPVNRGVYMGSTVIHPKYQSAKILSGIMGKAQFNWFRQVIEQFDPAFFWGEIRACDVRMQKYLARLGFKPVAILLDYDTGLGQRESEIIMTKYLKDSNMDEEVKILPEVAPFAEYSLNQLGLKRNYVYLNVKSDLAAKIFTIPEDFRYKLHFFPTWDGKLELKISPNRTLRIMVNSNEKQERKLISATMGKSRIRIEYNMPIKSARITCQGLEELPQGAVLLNWLDMWLRMTELIYADVFVSSTEPFVQAWFLQRKWKCAGYFPSYFPNVLTNTPEDAVILRLATPIRTKKLQLTREAYELCSMVLPRDHYDFEIKRDWNSKYRFVTLQHKEMEYIGTKAKRVRVGAPL